MTLVQFTVLPVWLVGLGVYLSVSVAASMCVGAFLRVGRGRLEGDDEAAGPGGLVRLSRAVGQPTPVEISAFRESAGTHRG